MIFEKLLVSFGRLPMKYTNCTRVQIHLRAYKAGGSKLRFSILLDSIILLYTMVCKKCEKKLATLAAPDKWKEGSKNVVGIVLKTSLGDTILVINVVIVSV
jgi:hypothetical protein